MNTAMTANRVEEQNMFWRPCLFEIRFTEKIVLFFNYLITFIDSISENTQMVLVNVVYFKGLWQIPFRPQSTLSRPFEVKRGVTKPAAFMRTRRYFRTGVNSYTGAQVIILPFEVRFCSFIFSTNA